MQPDLTGSDLTSISSDQVGNPAMLICGPCRHGWAFLHRKCRCEEDTGMHLASQFCRVDNCHIYEDAQPTLDGGMNRLFEDVKPVFSTSLAESTGFVNRRS